MAKPYALYIMDWNGTLRNDMSYMYEHNVLRIFRHFGRTAPTFKQYLDEVGTDFLAFYHAHGIDAGITASDLADVMAASPTSDERLPELYPDALDTLQGLLAVGASCALVTAYPDAKIRILLGQYGLANTFKVVAGSAKKKDQAFLRLTAELGTPRHATCAVGDMIEDAEAAKVAGLDAFLCPRGYHSRERIEAALPRLPQTQIIDSLSELLF